MAYLGELIVKLGVDAKGLERAESRMKEFGSSIKSFASTATAGGAVLSAALTAPIMGVATAAVKLAGEFQQTTIAFNTMLGSAKRANAFLKGLEDFAKRTPFEFKDLVTASKRMMALGFAAEEVIPTLTAVGDAAAALGGGAELISRVTLALGQMMAKGKVSGEEMRQLAEAGIPAWQILANTIGTSIPEAMKQAERGAIKAAEAVPAIIAGMGSKFSGLMAQQAQTMMGQLSNLKDQLFITMRDVGMSLLPIMGMVMDNFIKPAMTGLQKLAQFFADLPKPIQNVVIGLAALAAALGPLLVVFGGLAFSINSLIGLFTALSGILVRQYAMAAVAATTATAGLAGAQAAAATSTTALSARLGILNIPAGSAVIVIGAVALALHKMVKESERARQSMSEMIVDIKKSATSIKRDFADAVFVVVDDLKRMIDALRRLRDEVKESSAPGAVGPLKEAMAKMLGGMLETIDRMSPAIGNQIKSIMDFWRTVDPKSTQISVENIMESLNDIVAGGSKLMAGQFKVFASTMTRDWNQYVEGMKMTWQGFVQMMTGWDIAEVSEAAMNKAIAAVTAVGVDKGRVRAEAGISTARTLESYKLKAASEGEREALEALKKSLEELVRPASLLASEMQQLGSYMRSNTMVLAGYWEKLLQAAEAQDAQVRSLRQMADYLEETGSKVEANNLRQAASQLVMDKATRALVEQARQMHVAKLAVDAFELSHKEVAEALQATGEGLIVIDNLLEQHRAQAEFIPGIQTADEWIGSINQNLEAMLAIRQELRALELSDRELQIDKLEYQRRLLDLMVPVGEQQQAMYEEARAALEYEIQKNQILLKYETERLRIKNLLIYEKGRTPAEAEELLKQYDVEAAMRQQEELNRSFALYSANLIKIHQEGYLKMVDTVKDSAGQIFDAMIASGKSSFTRLIDWLKGTFLTKLRTLFQNFMAMLFTPSQGQGTLERLFEGVIPRWASAGAGVGAGVGDVLGFLKTQAAQEVGQQRYYQSLVAAFGRESRVAEAVSPTSLVAGLGITGGPLTLQQIQALSLYGQRGMGAAGVAPRGRGIGLDFGALLSGFLPAGLLGAGMAGITSGGTLGRVLGTAGLGVLGGAAAVTAGLIPGIGATGITSALTGMFVNPSVLLAVMTNPLILGPMIAAVAIPIIVKALRGKTTAEAGAMEVLRDLGIKYGKDAFKAFYEGIGLTEGEAWGIRKDLIISPKFLVEEALPIAEKTGEVGELAKRLQAVQTAWGTFDFSKAFLLGYATQDWTELNKQFVEVFGSSQKLKEVLPNWEKVLTTGDFQTELEKVCDSLAKLRNSLKNSIDAGQDMYDTFVETGEITEAFRRQIIDLGGDLVAFESYSMNVMRLRKELDELGKTTGALTDLRDRIRESTKAGADMYDVFFQTGEITEAFRRQIIDLGGDLELFYAYSSNVAALNEELSSLTETADALSRLRDSIRQSVSAGSEMYDVFLETGEITDEFADKIRSLGGDLGAFERVSRMQTILTRFDELKKSFLETGEITDELRQVFREFGGDITKLATISGKLSGLNSALNFVTQLISRLQSELPDPIEMLLSGKMDSEVIAALTGAGLDPSRFGELIAAIQARREWGRAKFQPFQEMTAELANWLTKYGGPAGAHAVEHYSRGFNVITQGLLDVVTENINKEYYKAIREILPYLESIEKSTAGEIASLTASIEAEFEIVGKNITASLNAAKMAVVNQLNVMISTVESQTGSVVAAIDAEKEVVVGQLDLMIKVMESRTEDVVAAINAEKEAIIAKIDELIIAITARSLGLTPEVPSPNYGDYYNGEPIPYDQYYNGGPIPYYQYYKEGGFVESTGLALVHAGEYIIPAEKAASIPRYDTGGWVRSTGLALLHEGEMVLPRVPQFQREVLSVGNEVSMLSRIAVGRPSYTTTVVIEGDVYGLDDLDNKLKKALGRLSRRGYQ